MLEAADLPRDAYTMETRILPHEVVFTFRVCLVFLLKFLYLLPRDAYTITEETR